MILRTEATGRLFSEAGLDLVTASTYRAVNSLLEQTAMRHFQTSILTATFVAMQTMLLHAQNASNLVGAQEALSDCLLSDEGQSEISACFGKVLAKCEKRFPDTAAIPKQCWEEELSAWNALLDTRYKALVEDLAQRGYGDFEAPIRVSQSHWIEQKDLDCKLEVSSNPRTYNVIWPACQARATMRRVAFLQELTGADWTPF